MHYVQELVYDIKFACLKFIIVIVALYEHHWELCHLHYKLWGRQFMHHLLTAVNKHWKILALSVNMHLKEDLMVPQWNCQNHLPQTNTTVFEYGYIPRGLLPVDDQWCKICSKVRLQHTREYKWYVMDIYSYLYTDTSHQAYDGCSMNFTC